MGDEFLTMVDRADRVDEKDAIGQTLWEKFLSLDNFEAAWLQIAKSQSSGTDGVTTHKFEKELNKNIKELLREVREGKYQAHPYKQLLIPKGEGKYRTIKIATVRDRIVQKALLNILAPELDKQFADNSFAYRINKSQRDAIQLTSKLRDEGYLWGVKADICDFFEEINHSKLLHQIQKYCPETITNLIKGWLESPTIQKSGEIVNTEKGLPQGGILSPLLSNLYLTSFDNSVECTGIKLIRYSDDILLLSKDKSQSYKSIKNLLAGLDLCLNTKKTQEISFEEGFSFLGHQFHPEIEIRLSAETQLTRHRNDVRVPARLFSHYGQCLKIWLYARWLDIKGTGKVAFSLFDAGCLLNRGESTIRKYLAQAARKGLIRHFSSNKEGLCTVFYTSLEKAVVNSGISELGPVASCPINKLEAIAITATEIEIAQLQKSSFFAAKQAQKDEGNPYKDLIPAMVNPTDLLTPTCEFPARVLGRTDRWIYVSEGFISYGGSQKSVATVRDITSRTVERHLSKRYRESPSPVKKYREDLTPLLKGQIAQRITRSRSKEFLAATKYFGEAGKTFKMGDRVFERKCNIYAEFDFHLVRCRFRRRRLKA